ncbi:MAG: hypothetical protein ABI182_00665 [Candidatus Baltobacteraceae bacterium]
MLGRVILGATFAVLALALGIVQFGSDAIFAGAAAPGSMPSHLSQSIGVRIYGAIERVAPAPYVEAMLTRAALDRGDLAQAGKHVERMPSSAARSEYAGRIAVAHGNRTIALREFLKADDVAALQADVRRLTSRDQIAAAYALELRIRDRLQQATTHPDALAESYWRLGQLGTTLGYEQPASRATRWAAGMRYYRQALALAPLSEKYLLAAASQAVLTADPAAAKAYFRRAIDVDPASADAYAGLGLVAVQAHDLAKARAYAARSRAIDPKAAYLKRLDAELR